MRLIEHNCTVRQGSNFIHVNPLLRLAEANASMKNAADFAIAQGGTAVVETIPSWYQFFFTKYVTVAEAVRTRVSSLSLFASL